MVLFVISDRIHRILHTSSADLAATAARRVECHIANQVVLVQAQLRVLATVLLAAAGRRAELEREVEGGRGQEVALVFVQPDVDVSRLCFEILWFCNAALPSQVLLQ